jgi:hypothetical protein
MIWPQTFGNPQYRNLDELRRIVVLPVRTDCAALPLGRGSCMSSVKALQGQWYANRATHDVFYVIAVDEDDGLIDVRDGYGDIDEFDIDEWDAMDLVVCSAPEAWQLSLDDLDDLDDFDEEGESSEEERQKPAAGPTHHIKSSGTT